MAAAIIDGRKIANSIKMAIKGDLENMGVRQKDILRLAVLQIGHNPSSEIYINAQKKLAGEFGIKYYVKTLKTSASQKTAEQEVDKLNNDKRVTGILIHTPTPKHINAGRLFGRIAPGRDVEGLNPANIGKLLYGDSVIAPCTASACMTLIDSTGVKLRGKEVVIVGHSEIVGKPLSLMLLAKMATTTVCHVGTYEQGSLKDHVRRADVLVVSVGKHRLIKANWIRKGAIVIDVGINKYKGAVTGDVDFSAAKKRASYITPVPGGVGPLTAVLLMKNLIALYKDTRGIKK